MVHLRSNADDTYQQQLASPFEFPSSGMNTHRKRGEHQRCRSSWTPRCRHGRGRQYRREQQGYAIFCQHIVNCHWGTGITYAKDALGTDQFDELVLLGANGVALGIGLEVTKVTDVTNLILGGTVGFAEGVEVGPSRGAAVGVVTELVDVEATLSVGIVAGNVP